MFAQFLAQNYLNSLPRRVSTGLNSEWSDFFESEPQKTINEQNNTKQDFEFDNPIDRKIYIKKCSFQNIDNTILKFHLSNYNNAQETLIEDCQFNSITSTEGSACILHYNSGKIAINRNTFSDVSYKISTSTNSFALRASNISVYSTSIHKCGNTEFQTEQTFLISGYHKVTTFNVTDNNCIDNVMGVFFSGYSDCYIGFSNFIHNIQLHGKYPRLQASLYLQYFAPGFNYELMFTNIMFNNCVEDHPLIEFDENANFRFCIIANNSAKFHFNVNSKTIKFIDCILQEYKVTTSGQSGNVTEEKVFGRIPPIVANPIELAPRPIVVYCTADAHYANLKRARQNYLYT